ncbi:cell division protein FtsZ [Microbulbifer thermotolerans]|uniref:Cell division protein FtsZ n=1 Tax=Microbulbifer thermotolerans TaxID=252514 RepID=A0A143HKP8_MICTH|nr:cell division protein FtsZ [Microbulbifer thermotolerans]AMX02066.1 cell division protein FtsZ [Microbulbifer thermotolerans]MCX2781388.1 cell division protein FtsZ [Microbulbifer thermotolerans]MCX2793875.1 cell division protein FtsZ [Microbulbifer thermotolerans]MCX2830099.1 cell division protein FtsZ [Microbulbifer thermotolerans]MCX2834297.1 cell division protein FtsZ [Microbulbifer thermotolerans]
MFELVDSVQDKPVIKVIGVGGGGGNAVKHMIASEVEGVDFICANTDAQALKDIQARTILQLGNNITRGLGAGANPDVGRQSALEDRDRIAEVLTGADMVFITAGMGGGTGTGGAPIVAEIAKDLGILTVAVVTRPFTIEGKKRSLVAEEGIRELRDKVDSLITIPNDRLLEVLGNKITMKAAYKEADNVLLGAVQGIADLMIRPGIMNVDFADVRTVMSEMGMAMMGSGSAVGENRAREAAEKAVRSPLLDNVNLQGARGILVNIITGSEEGGCQELTLGEYSEVGEIVQEIASDDATVVIGTAVDDKLGDEMRVTVVAAGLGEGVQQAARPTKVVDNTRRAQLHEGREAREGGQGGLAGRDAADNRVRVESERPKRPAPTLNPADADMEYLDIPAFLRRQAD